MKYRELVFVLVVVAVVILWISGPQTRAEDKPQEPIAKQTVAEPTPGETVTLDRPPLKAAPPESNPRMEPEAFYNHPRVEVKVVGTPERLDDLVVRAKLVVSEPLSIRIMEDGKPFVGLVCQVDEEVYPFASRGDAGKGRVEQATAGQWEIRLSDLQYPEKVEALRAAFLSNKIEWTLSLHEAEEETNPMTRRIVMPVMGGFVTNPKP